MGCGGGRTFDDGVVERVGVIDAVQSDGEAVQREGAEVACLDRVAVVLVPTVLQRALNTRGAAVHRTRRVSQLEHISWRSHRSWRCRSHGRADEDRGVRARISPRPYPLQALVPLLRAQQPHQRRARVLSWLGAEQLKVLSDDAV